MDTFHKHHPSQKRYTIGVLASTLLNENGRELWYGLVDLPKERGFNTIYFAGGWLNDPNDFDSQSNIVYDLIDEKKVDGLIIWTSALGRFVSNDEVQQFCERYRPLPIVSLGAPLAGIPSVLIDSYQAMSDMLTHLIEVHNCRQIAFIRGPSGHFDTEERVRAYKDVLAKYRIDFNPRLLSAPGPWHNTHSRDAIRLMLDEYKVSFDAVACSSDSFVEGVHGELSSRGYRIPEDVALVGFDNKPTCQTMEPPLTTIPIMMYDRVQIAANMLLQMLNGEPVPEQVFVSCPLIIRRSCGCNPSVSRSNHLRKPLKLPSKIVSADRIIKRYRRQILEELNQVFNPSDIFSDQNWNEQLLDNLITDLGDASSASFLAAFQKIFERKEIEYLNIAKWHQFLTVFHPRDEWGLNRYQYQKIMDILDQAKNYLLEMEAKIESKRRHKMEVFTERLIEIGHSLTAISSFNELTDVLAQEIPKLGIPSYYLSLYDQRENSYEWSRLILACNLNERIPIDLKNGGVKFRSRELIPEGYFTDQQVWNQIVEPIFFREHQLGFAIFETGPKEAVVYAMLRTQLSSALWGVIFFEKQKKTEAALAWKAQELARSNSELERFAYVASHDLQEPLRKITLFGESLAKTAKAKLNEKERDYLERMINAAGRMQRLIIDLLTFSRVTTKARPFTMVDLNEVGKEVVSDLEVKIRNTNADIEIGELPSIEAEPVQMRQLFQNLIGNSLKFHRPNIPPRIRVYGRITPEQQCELTFEDNGIGIDPSNYQKIFGLFERLHGMGEYEGSGVGLAICHKIVERHRGEIKIDSQVGVGTKFIICLPVHQTDLSA